MTIMKTANFILHKNGRLRHDMVLLRRIKPRTERIEGAFNTEVVFEEHASGLALSDPGREVTRCEVLKAGPDCRLQVGDQVVIRSTDKLSGMCWHEDGQDYVLTKETDEQSPDILFKYRVMEVTA